MRRVLLVAVACTALLLYTAYDAQQMGEAIVLKEKENYDNLFHNVAHKVMS